MAASKRVLEPSSPETEEAIIGAACFLENEPWLAPVRRMVTPECFTSPLWRDCWTVLEELWDEDLAADIVTLAHRVWRRNAHGFAHEGTMLAELMRPLGDVGVAFWAIPAYAKTLSDLRLRRDLIALSGDVAGAAHTDQDAEGVKAYTEAMLDAMDAHRGAAEDGSLAAALAEIEGTVEHGATVLSSGLPHWDDWLDGGLRAGDTHVVGGPTGAGKSWVGVQIAATAGLAGHGVAYISLEMKRAKVWTRLFSVPMGRAAYRMRGTGPVWTEAELESYRDAKARFSGTTRVFNLERSVARIRAIVETFRPAVVVVDYVQLLDAPRGAKSLYESATQNAGELQALAMRSGAVVVLLTQMGRAAIREGRKSGIPGGMDSGRIDHVADSWLRIDAEDDGFLLDAPKVREGPSPIEPVKYRLSAIGGGLVPAVARSVRAVAFDRSMPTGDR